MEIKINVYGDGSIYSVSSSAIGGIRPISSSDNNGSGVYADGYDYKFTLNKRCLSATTRSGVVTLPSKDDSFYTKFTVLSTTTTASIDIVFPSLQNHDGIYLKKIPTGSMQVVTSSIGYSIPETLIQFSGKSLPNDDDYSRGYMIRYFYKKTNDVKSFVKELNKNQYNEISSRPLYKSLQIRWKITGTKDDVTAINTNVINNAELQLPGIKYVLINPTQYLK